MGQGGRPNVVFIVGATASGKTAAALRLAATLPIEIINADSRPVYRGMSIGTAKPTAPANMSGGSARAGRCRKWRPKPISAPDWSARR